jgi:hypothetical protein
MTELCDLGNKYHTDKVSVGYTSFYHLLFKNKRDIKKVLELGIGSFETMKHVPDYIVGASLFMWREYFTNAEIYGIDIDPSTLINEDRIHSFISDQSSPEILRHTMDNIGGDLDFVIDDADHRAEYQIRAARVLLPFVRPGGIYIIEDALEQDVIVNNLPSYHPQKVSLRAGGKLVMVKVNETSSSS